MARILHVHGTVKRCRHAHYWYSPTGERMTAVQARKAGATADASKCRGANPKALWASTLDCPAHVIFPARLAPQLLHFNHPRGTFKNERLHIHR